MKYDPRKIGARIQAARKKKGMRQEDLAEYIGKSPTYIGMLERGQRSAKLKTFVDIITVLDVRADYILSDVVEKGYKARLLQYEEEISKLNLEDREKIYSILDAYLEQCR